MKHQFRRSRLSKYGISLVVLLLIVSLYYLAAAVNSFILEPGITNAIWVQSQNGNDDEALLNIKSSSTDTANLKYTVEKYAEIGIIALPDATTNFSSLHDGRKIRDISTAPFAGGLTIIDLNKTSYMDGLIKYWNVVSREDDNEVRLGVFRYDDAASTYYLVQCSPFRTARKGRNAFLEEIPLYIQRNDILGLQTTKPISSNRVVVNELAKILTRSGFQSRIEKSEAVEDSGSRGSFSYSALLEAGEEQGEIARSNIGETVIQLPQNPVYGHVAWYQFSFFSDTGAFSLKPGLASILLNADPYIGLMPANDSPWTPRAFSFPFFALLALLFASTTLLISSEPTTPSRLLIAMVSIIVLFGFSKYFSSSHAGFQFVAIVAAFIVVFLLPGVIASRFYPSYGHEHTSGRIILAFVLSLVCWLPPAIGLFLVKTSYWPVAMATVFLIILSFFKPPFRHEKNGAGENLTPYWQTVQILLWGIVGLLAVHTLFSSRFHAELFDSFHHFSLAAKYSGLPIAGDLHPNLFDVSMRTVAPYAYNLWGLLVGLVVTISGLDVGTIYCVGNSLLVLLTFIAQWWLIGLFVESKKIKITAFAIIIVIYVTRTLATFAVWFQRTEFTFITYGPSVHEFVLYAVYIVLGIRAIHSKRSADVLIYCGLSLAMAFFHLEFVFFNALVLALLTMLSLRENGKLCLNQAHAYFLSTIVLLGAAGLAVTSRLALGSVVDASSAYHATFYALRYEDLPFLQRFYYIFLDLLKLINTYIWHAVAIWGGLLLVIFRSRKVSLRLFTTAYFIIIVMLLFSYNPISDMVFTPLMTSWPVKRIEIYLRAITFTFASIVLSVAISYVARFLKRPMKYAPIFAVSVFVLMIFVTVSTHKQWLPQLCSTVDTVTYNRGNFVDITAMANLPEMKFLNEYSKGKYVNVLVEHPYNYTIPSLSRAYSYFHTHYPKIEFQSSYLHREVTWHKCLQADSSCVASLPEDSLLLVRNDNAARLIQIGCDEIYRGRLFTVLKV